MSSGYVVQTSIVEDAAAKITADIGAVCTRVPGENASYSNSGDSSVVPRDPARVAEVQARLSAAVAQFEKYKDTMLAPKFGSADEAQQWFAGFAQPITDKYGPELGTNIITDFQGSYWLEDLAISPNYNYKAGVGSSVFIRPRTDDMTRVASAHTHPGTGSFSTTDIGLAATRQHDAYVSTKGGNSRKFSYEKYKKEGGEGMSWESVTNDSRFFTPVRRSP